jgi:hypothetical protein
MRQEPLILNRPFRVERDLAVTPVMCLERASFMPDFVPVSDPQEAQRFEHPVVRVRVSQSDVAVGDSGWLEALGAGGVPTASTFLGGRMALVYRAQDPEPQDYRGTLVLLDAQGQERSRSELSIKHPVTIQGMRIAVDDEVPEDPAAMALCVTRKPGRYLLWIGVCLMGLALIGELAMRMRDRIRSWDDGSA